jgi:hypothetical protein
MITRVPAVAVMVVLALACPSPRGADVWEQLLPEPTMGPPLTVSGNGFAFELAGLHVVHQADEDGSMLAASAQIRR